MTSEAIQPVANFYDPRIVEKVKEFCLKNPNYTFSEVEECVKASGLLVLNQFKPGFADAIFAIEYLMKSGAIPARDRVGA